MDYWRFLPEEKDILIQKLTFALPALRGITKATQDEIANAIGVSRQTYNAIEIQKRTMSWNTYISLIQFFDYNPNSHIMTNLLKYICEITFRGIKNFRCSDRGALRKNGDRGGDGGTCPLRPHLHLILRSRRLY